ncbi:MAG: hypothetical protein ACSHYC_05895 [Alphaproteobacteria bacterium]
MNYIKETLWERFFNRLPAKEANDAVRILKRGGSYKDVDFFTLKEAEEQVQRYRGRAKAAIADYKLWKANTQIGRFFAVFRDREGIALRNHARDMANMFLEARRDYIDLSSLLMTSIANDTRGTASSDKGGRNG